MIDWDTFFWVVLLVLLMNIILFYLLGKYNTLKGKSRIIWGEMIRDLGIGIGAGTIFKYSIVNDTITFLSLILISGIMVGVGTSMKENIPLFRKIKIKKTTKRIIIFLVLIVGILGIYLYITNEIEDRFLYPTEKEWFSLFVDAYVSNESCIKITPIYINYYNDVSDLKGIQSQNLLKIDLNILRYCHTFGEGRIMISATDLIKPTIIDYSNLSNLTKINETRGSFNVELTNSSDIFQQEITLLIPINNNFFNYYLFSSSATNISMIDFTFKKDVINGYLLNENYFSLVNGNMDRPEPILRGKYKRYILNDTPSALIRFVPEKKIWFLTQKILDAILLGILSILIYEFFKGNIIKK